MKTITNKGLALYLGGEAKILQTIRNNQYLVKVNDTEIINENFLLFFSKCPNLSEYLKPILRSIKSITDDECLLLLKLCMDSEYQTEISYVIDRTSFSNAVVVSDENNKFYIGYNGNLRWYKKNTGLCYFNTHVATCFFLSNRFDLFLFLKESYLIADNGVLIEPADCNNDEETFPKFVPVEEVVQPIGDSAV